MRKLLYVPVIHVDSDLGSMASSIEKRSVQICGRERWERHKQTVSIFWDNIEKYFNKVNADNLKIYQDGLMADGELGQKIIKEGAQKGSRNYQIVLDLVRKSAEIRKTEDVALLKEEYNRIIKLSQSKSIWERTVAYIGYRFHRDKLMEKRDRFIADNINHTLKEGETGVLFIGAYHNVFAHIAKDITIEEVKKREKVKAYFKMLISGRDKERFDELAEYLVKSEQWVVDSDQRIEDSNEQRETSNQ